jgi:integrase
VGTVYAREGTSYWWMAWFDVNGKRQQASTETADRAKAERVLELVERQVQAQKEAGVREDGPLTVARYFERWMERRHRRSVGSADDDETRVRLHALPVRLPGGQPFGHALLEKIRPRHIQAVVEAYEATGAAPRSVLNMYGVLRVMFRQALMDDLISSTPCVLSQKAGELPKKRDKDPSWRSKAVFARQEVEALISNPSITERRRVIYAVEFLAGVRANELTPRRWTDYDTAIEPLGKLTVATSYNLKKKVENATTKTGVTRQVPVHPTLAKILAEWKLSGWRTEYGRDPKPSDLIVPGVGSPESFLSSTSNLKRLHEDLERLGYRPRRQHDARSTFISLCLADGGRKDILRWVTHPPADQMDEYTRLPWEALCEEVAKLRIQRRDGQLIQLVANSSSYSTATGKDKP